MILAIVGCRTTSQFEADGQITALAQDSGQVAIKHDGIPGLAAASTLQVLASRPSIVDGLQVGDKIHFVLQRSGNQLSLLKAARKELRERPGVHDHTPHHGGIVVMVGMIHLEVLATADGHIRVYLTDVWRRPLPLDQEQGSVRVNFPDGRQTLPLVNRDDYLEASGPRIPVKEINVQVFLQRREGPIEMSFQLALQPEGIGAAGVDAEGCLPPPDARPGGPRCVLHMAAPVSALTTTPSGDRLVVAAVGLGVTIWTLPELRLQKTLAAAPAVTAPVDEAPHLESISVLAPSPDGREMVVALESRLLVYSLSNGTLLRELPYGRGTIRSASWSTDGHSLLVTSFYDASASLVRADDGSIEARFPVEREAASGVVLGNGRSVLVGGETGIVRQFSRSSGKEIRQWSLGGSPWRELRLIDETRFVGVSDEGRVAVWSVDQTDEILSFRAGLLPSLALDARHLRFTFGGSDGILHEVDLRAKEEVPPRFFHRRAVSGIAWSRFGLISADDSGDIVVW